MEDKHDKEMMRNQLIAFVLMAILVVFYFKFFLPPPPTRQPAPAPKAVQSQQQPEQPQETPAPPSEAGWSELPPVPAIANAADAEVTLANEDLELVFTRVGARLKKATVLARNGGGSQQLVPVSDKTDTESVYPLGLEFTEPGLGEQANSRLWEVAGSTADSVAFELAIPDRGVIRKKFTLSAQSHAIDVEVSYQNTGLETVSFGLDQTPAYYVSWAPDVIADDLKTGAKQTIIWRKAGQNEEVVTDKLSRDGKPYLMTTPGVEWLAVKNTYFLMALKPEFEAVGLVEGLPRDYRVGLGVPSFALEPGEIKTNQYRVYVGPSEHGALAAAWESLGTAQKFFSYGWLDWFAKLLLALLNWFYAHVIGNYGLAIIFLTIVVRMAMLPLTIKSMKSMKKMQLLGPELEQLKQKYGEDQQELNKKMMEMYKERGVNPVGGCFPLALQLPVFVALYRMLWYAYELRGAPFVLWMTDLSQPDRLFRLPWLANLPIIGMFEYINVLPILCAAAMLISQKVTPTTGPATNPQQKLMMNIMPVMVSFFFYNVASGLNLYVLTSTLLGMLQQMFVHVGQVELQPKKTPPKKQHFYTAAMARKRQIEKEAKKDSKRKPK